MIDPVGSPHLKERSQQFPNIQLCLHRHNLVQAFNSKDLKSSNEVGNCVLRAFAALLRLTMICF